MKLLEFITYCQLKNLVESHEEVGVDWDIGADHHHKIIILNDKYTATLRYAVIGDTGVIVNSTLWLQTELGMECFSQPDLKQIVRSILEGDHEPA